MQQLLVLNLDSLEETRSDIEGIDIDSREGEKCVPLVVKWQLARARFGTAKTKLMSEVTGSTRKIVRQKGSGGARHGSRRAVQFVGGRTCFGPQPRDFSFSIPRKIVARARKFVLREKVKNDRVILIEGMDSLGLSTRGLAKKLRTKNIERALVVCDEEYKNFALSLRNLFNYKSLTSEALNVLDILNFDYLLFDKKLLNNLEEALV
ncbi:MAG: 50S ribosomal protein L4 [Rickettsiales bacterium]|jgi:large subunit ribosomal protein L4|nr:50S ribosomal protein L4 [Rickettsiales bacterium]